MTIAAPRTPRPLELPYSEEAASRLRALDRAYTVVPRDGAAVLSEGRGAEGAFIPPCLPGHLGDPAFLSAHGLRFAYVGGSMANGISSTALAEALGRAGMLGFYGAAGQPVEEVEKAISRLQAVGIASGTCGASGTVPAAGNIPFGFNLIHSPSDPALETALVDLYLQRGVRLIEASAFIGLTLPLIRFRTAGIRRTADGSIETLNRVIGKVSRVEVAERFFSPPPEKFLKELVSRGELTPGQAGLAALIPVAEDVTAEGDSGGHTDNRPLVNLLPTIIALRDRIQAERGYARAPRVGAGGGIATPESAAAAFMMGAAYLVTGSVNQACVESGATDLVRRLLAAAEQADTTMAAAADMFEMGVRVQVLKRGTMFAMRANKLYDYYRTYASFDALPADIRATLERDYFRAPFEDIWNSTRDYFLKRDPSQAERAERDPKHKMALVFRWYLSRTSRWPLAGDESRKMDYQIWCGPSMGAFNEWTRGSFLEAPAGRDAVAVSYNLLAGAAALTRLHALRCQGVAADPRLARQEPRPREELAVFFS